MSRTRSLLLPGATALAVLALTLAAPGPARAQLKLPRPSPKAALEQTIGLTDLRITYSRPGVKGRVIWGELVPYDKVWRTGANEATTIALSSDVKVNGHPLKAGTYSLHTIPTKNDWTVIFNTEADQWGSYAYNDSADALRIKVSPQPHEFTEWMQFSFPAMSVEKATIALDWEKLRIPFEIEVNTIEQALASARAAMAALEPDNHTTAFRSASFAFQNNVAPAEARQWVDKSIAIKETWLNLRLKADMLAKEGKRAEAIEFAQRAIEGDGGRIANGAGSAGQAAHGEQHAFNVGVVNDCAGGALLALACILHGLLRGAFCNADALQAHGEARSVHHRKHTRHALVLLADEEADRAGLVAIDHGAGGRGIDAELVLDRVRAHVVACAVG